MSLIFISTGSSCFQACFSPTILSAPQPHEDISPVQFHSPTMDSGLYPRHAAPQESYYILPSLLKVPPPPLVNVQICQPGLSSLARDAVSTSPVHLIVRQISFPRHKDH